MKLLKGLVLFAALLAIGVMNASCTQEQIAANEAKAAAIVAAVKSGASVALSALKDGVDTLCANQMAAASAAGVARQAFSTQSGPNTQANLTNLDTALATYNAVCAQASANPNNPAMKQLLLQAQVAYNQVKAAQVKAMGG